jgi:hypothetical protein
LRLHRTISSPRRRTAIAAAVAALAITVPTVAAHAAGSPRAETSGGVIQRQLAASGSHFSTVFNGTEFPDYGLTLDGILAMDSAGVGDYRSEKATDYVAAHIMSYISDGDPADADTERYAGATAKSLLVSLTQKRTPKGNLGGVNLITALKARENATTGRFSDLSSFGDFSNTFTQVYALVSLKRAGQTLSANSMTFLHKQQCPNGGFRISEATATCSDSSQADTDATSLGVQALLAEPKTAARTTRINKAIAYLKTRMNSAGGVKGGSPTNTPNANSTGLAVMSFDSTGNTSWGTKGRGYLTTLRFGCAYPAKMRGAVAYDKARITEAKSQGSKAKLVDQDIRATTQAVLGFSGTSLLAITNTGAKFSSPTVQC